MVRHNEREHRDGSQWRVGCDAIRAAFALSGHHGVMRRVGAAGFFVLAFILGVTGAGLVVVTVMSMGGSEFFVPAVVLCLLLWLGAALAVWCGSQFVRGNP
jgi:hypothetical protein